MAEFDINQVLNSLPGILLQARAQKQRKVEANRDFNLRTRQLNAQIEANEALRNLREREQTEVERSNLASGKISKGELKVLQQRADTSEANIESQIIHRDSRLALDNLLGLGRLQQDADKFGFHKILSLKDHALREELGRAGISVDKERLGILRNQALIEVAKFKHQKDMDKKTLGLSEKQFALADKKYNFLVDDVNRKYNEDVRRYDKDAADANYKWNLQYGLNKLKVDTLLKKGALEIASLERANDYAGVAAAELELFDTLPEVPASPEFLKVGLLQNLKGGFESLSSAMSHSSFEDYENRKASTFLFWSSARYVNTQKMEAYLESIDPYIRFLSECRTSGELKKHPKFEQLLIGLSRVQLSLGEADLVAKEKKAALEAKVTDLRALLGGGVSVAE